MNALARITDETQIIPLRPRTAAGPVQPGCPHCGAPMALRWPALDAATNTIVFDGRTVRLERKIAQLLRALVEVAPGCATNAHLTAKIWGGSYILGSNALAVHVSRTRRLLRRLKAPVVIDTFKGVGYRLRFTGRSSS